jgi:hypothetical protein
LTPAETAAGVSASVSILGAYYLAAWLYEKHSKRRAPDTVAVLLPLPKNAGGDFEEIDISEAEKRAQDNMPVYYEYIFVNIDPAEVSAGWARRERVEVNYYKPRQVYRRYGT